MATSSNASATAGGASTNASGSTGSASTVDIKAPLWAYVNILEKPKIGGSNVLWKCKYCSMEKFTSYTRVEAHLLQKSGRGIIKCDKMPYEVLCEMKREVKRCEELVQRGKARTVSMPTAPAPAPSGNTSKKKRGPASALEKAWALEDRKHLDALIVRSIYSGGISFNFLRNPYF